MKPHAIITGTVIKHLGRGKQLGFPTANITYTGTLPEGVYVARVQIQSDIYCAVAFIGTADTFNDFQKRLEVHLLDFNQDIYGEDITIELLDYIRKNNRYPSKEALIEQIKKDIIYTRQYHYKCIS